MQLLESPPRFPSSLAQPVREGLDRWKHAIAVHAGHLFGAALADDSRERGQAPRLELPHSVPNLETAPPSTTRVWPVMNEERLPSARKRMASAISSGLPIRPSGVRSASVSIALTRSSVETPARSIGVSTAPGRTALTRIPSGARSRAAARASATSAPLLVAYAATPREVASAWTELTLTIAPPWMRILGWASRVSRY